MSNFLREDPFVKAEKRGMCVVVPESDQLFVDLDNAADAAKLREHVSLAQTIGLGVTIERITPSTSPGHSHAVLRVDLSNTCWDELTDELRIALQACFGSDRKRELLSLAKALFSVPSPPTLFFEKKG